MSVLNDQEKVRVVKLNHLREQGIDPYPARLERRQQIIAVLDKWKINKPATVAGRITSVRGQGKLVFIDLTDGTGRIQIFCQANKLPDQYQQLVDQVDIGDFLLFSGTCFETKRGERTIDATKFQWLAKSLRPLPSKWHGLEDVEIRYRHRELDLISNAEIRQLFVNRAIIVKTIRDLLNKQEFLEVETPVLQPVVGGATARPFVTHHQSLDIDLFLRVAPELYLKRLIIGGYERVFEFARCFRNEGFDRDHNPEFTQVELYAAYQDYNWMMELTEELVTSVAQAVHHKPMFKHRGQEIAFITPFPRFSYRQLIKEHTKIDIDLIANTTDLLQQARAVGTDIADGSSRAKIIDELFKTHVRSKLITPTFVIDYPLELSPLAKKKTDDPNYTERFQLLMGGTEIGNAFTELNDPLDQRQRFADQEKLRQHGDDEAQRTDENFLEALEYGMPPTAGLGIGIERLTMALTGQTQIKEVILFPTLKPTS